MSELRDSGLLWLINATVFHPRGFALVFTVDAEEHVIGWDLMGDGTEPRRFEHDDEMKARFNAAVAEFDRHRPSGDAQ